MGHKKLSFARLICLIKCTLDKDFSSIFVGFQNNLDLCKTDKFQVRFSYHDVVNQDPRQSGQNILSKKSPPTLHKSIM